MNTGSLPRATTNRRLLPLVTVLFATLLACGGGRDTTRCSATLDYQGGSSAGQGADGPDATHSACRSWCTARNAGQKKDSDAIASCASRCGADVMFGHGSAKVACQ